MRALITVLLLVTVGCSTVITEPAADYAFVDVNVLEPASGRILSGQTVLVTADRITAVGAEITAPETALRIDGSGRYLVPGLSEMHAHVPKQKDGTDYLNDVLFLYVANGITTIRGMNGEAAHLELRSRIQRGELIAPRLITAGPPLLGKGAGTPEEAAQKVADQANAGFDFIKVHMGLPAEDIEQIVESLDKDDDAFLKVMMALEFGVVEEERRSPYTAGVLSGLLFLAGSLPSVLPFLFVDSTGFGLFRRNTTQRQFLKDANRHGRNVTPMLHGLRCLAAALTIFMVRFVGRELIRKQP